MLHTTTELHTTLERLTTQDLVTTTSLIPSPRSLRRPSSTLTPTMLRATCMVRLRRHPQRLLSLPRAPTRTVQPLNATTRLAEGATVPTLFLRSTRVVRPLHPAHRSTALQLRRRTQSTRVHHHRRCLNPPAHGVLVSLRRPRRSR